MLRNPRFFSFRLGIGIAVGSLGAVFLGLAFDFGNGSFYTGFHDAALYLLIFGIAFLIPGTILGAIAVLIGRVIGTTLTATLASGLFAILIIRAFDESQPLTRFRDFVWKEAPGELVIDRSEKWTTFNDGSSYIFVVSCDDIMLKELCLGIGLEETPPS